MLADCFLPSQLLMCLSLHMGCPCTPVSVSFVKLILFLCVHRSRGFVLVGFAIFWYVLVISFSSYLRLFIFFQFWAFSHVCPRVLSGTSLRSYCSVVNWSVYARFGNNLFSILLNIGWYGKSCKNIGIQRKGKKRKRNRRQKQLSARQPPSFTCTFLRLRRQDFYSTFCMFSFG